MPHRDPETGQFVSSPGQHSCFEEMDVAHGNITHRVDAADLSGGEFSQETDAAEAIVDFGETLDTNSVAEIVAMYFRGQAYGPTTATDESWLRAVLQLSSEPNLAGEIAVGNPLSGQDLTDGVVDTKASGGVNNEVLWQTAVQGITNHDDAANSEGGGPHVGESEEFVDFRGIFGGGPVLDDDDELFGPAVIVADNISDHRIVTEFNFTVWYKEWERQDCPVMARR